MKFHESLANYVLGNLETNELIQVALNALEEGFESKSLAMLAGESWLRDPQPDDVKRYFHDTLQELEITLPSLKQAAEILIQYYLAQLLSAEVEPYQALRDINFEVYISFGGHSKNEHFIGDCLDIAELLGLYYEYDDLHGPFIEYGGQRISKSQAVEILNESVRDKAREYLDRHNNDRTS